MWHITLLKILARKICKNDPSAADSFIDDLFNACEEPLTGYFMLEPIMLMGLIKDLYLYEREYRDQDVTPSEFARTCLGLFILHFKNNKEYSVQTKNFLFLIKDGKVFKALNIQDEIGQFIVEYYCGNVISQIFPSSYIANYVLIPNAAYLKMLNQIEKKELERLNYTIEVNLNHFAFIFSALFSQVEEKFGFISSFMDFILPYKRKDKEFDEFISGVSILEKQLFYPMINDICEQLENYVHVKHSKYHFHFITNSCHQHRREVSHILDRVRSMEFSDIGFIMDSLKSIKIINPDDALVEIIETLEERYEDEFGTVCHI